MLLKLDSIKKTFCPQTVNETAVLTDLTFYVEEGEFISILGSNGTGKSTLLNLIAGIERPDEGEINLR